MNKKVILIPAVMCLAALSSCGQNNNSILAGLKNGFESVEYEKYFSLPSNLFTIEKGYGQYVAQTSAINTATRVRSTKATNFEVGTAPFFANMPMFTPGTKQIVFYPTNNNASGMVQDSKVNVRVSPFTSNVSKREAETTVKYYGSKDTNPVLHEVESSIRSDYDSYTQTTIKSQPTSDEYIQYIDNIPETEEKTIFTLVRSHNLYGALQKENNSSFDADIVYKKMKRLSEEDDPKEILDKDARATLITQIANVTSAFEEGEPECATFNNLSEIGISAETNTQHAGGATSSDFTFLSDGKGNIYEYSYMASDDVDVPVYNNAPYEYTVKGFEVSEAIVKLRYDNNIGWLIDNMTTAAKVYVKADAKLKPYATPKCLCSEYRHIDINYGDLGEFGNIEDAELYQDAPDLLVNLSINNLDESVPSTVGSKVLVCDPNEDENMYINGGIYDHTFSARKAGLIKNDQYVFYGEANLGTQLFAETPQSEYELTQAYTSSHYYVQTTLVSRNGATTINVEPYSDDETKGSTIDKKLSDTITIYDGAVTPKAIEVNYGDDEEQGEGKFIGGRVVNFYILLEKENENYTVEEFTITPGANNFAPAAPEAREKF